MTAHPLGRMLASLLALFGGAAASQAAPVAAVPPPAAWVAYAEEATRTVIRWLNAAEPPAPSIRATIEKTRPAPREPTPPLVVRIWVDPAGTVTRVEFPALPDAQATADLRGLLVGKPLGAPPRDMRQPMRLALQLAPAPQPDTTAQI